MSEINKKLQKTFEKSVLIQEKLPNLAQREHFLQNMLKGPDYKKEAFLILLERADEDLSQKDDQILAVLRTSQEHAASIKKSAKKIYKEAELTHRDEQAEDILKDW